MGLTPQIVFKASCNCPKTPLAPNNPIYDIERFGLKVPMRPFFAVTGATLAFMAFVFAGDGIKELQEGGYIGSTVLGWAPRSDFFTMSLRFAGGRARNAISLCL